MTAKQPAASHPHTPATHPTTPTLRSILIATLAVFALALALRLTALHEVRHLGFITSPLSDARIYADAAETIATSNILAPADFVHAPLYAYFLAPIHAIAAPDNTTTPQAHDTTYHWLIPARIAQLTLGSLAAAAIIPATLAWFALLPTTTTPNRQLLPATAAAAFAALYAPAIFHDLIIQKATLNFALTVAFLWALAIAWARSRNQNATTTSTAIAWAALGVILALFTLNRQNALALAILPALMPLAAAFLPPNQPAEPHRPNRTTNQRPPHPRPLHRALIATAAAFLALAATLLPWAARNNAVIGDWVISTPNLGQNLLMGNRADATGTYLPTIRGQATAEREQAVWVRRAQRDLDRPLTPAEVSNYYRDQAIQWIIQNPAEWARLTIKKIQLVIAAFEAPDTEDLYHYKQHARTLQLTDTIFHFGTLFPIAAFAITLTLNQRRTLWPLYAFIIITALSVAAFVVFGRYRFPLVPALLILAATATPTLLHHLKHKQHRALIPPAIAAAVAALLANAPPLPPRQPQTFSFVNHAAVLADAGRTNEALAEAQNAINLDPQSPDAHAIRASILVDLNRLEEAQDHYATATRLDPRFPGAWVGLGNVALQTNRPLDAARAYQQALLTAPDDPTAHAQLAAAYAQLGQIQQAQTQLQTALDIDPDSPIALTNLATPALIQNRPDDAIEPLQRAIEADPRKPEPRINLVAALLATNQPQRAIETARQAWQANPTHTPTQQLYFEALLRTRQFQQAQQALDQIEQADPNAAQRWTTNARSQLEQALQALNP